MRLVFITTLSSHGYVCKLPKLDRRRLGQAGVHNAAQTRALFIFPMGILNKLTSKMEHRRLANQYGKRRKSAIQATQRATEGYEFEEVQRKPSLVKRISSLKF